MRFRSAIDREVNGLLSRRQPGNFNQALMELGQTVCLPRAPRCPACPLRRWCVGFRQGNPEAYPAPRPRRATESHYLAAAVIRRGERLALIRGLDDGLLADLWNFPSAFGRTPAAALDNLGEKLSGLVGREVEFGARFAEVRHTITHRSIRVDVYPAEIRRMRSSRPFNWLTAEQLDGAAVSQLARKISARLS